MSLGWLLAIVAVASVLLGSYGRMFGGENFSAPSVAGGLPGAESGPVIAGAGTAPDYAPFEGDEGAAPENGCYPQDRLTSADLLPRDAADAALSQQRPAGQGSFGDGNFLSAGHNVGVSTSFTRNQSYDLRSVPVVPKTQASVWNNSTFDSPDLMRKPLDSSAM